MTTNTADNNCLITCSESVKIWDWKSQALLHEVLPSDASNSFRRLCYSENNMKIACVSTSGTSLLIISCDSEGFRNLEHPLTLNAKISTAVFCKTDLFLGCTSGELLQWDCGRSRIIKAFPGHDSEITSLSISMDNDRIASGSIRGNIYIHNIVMGTSSLLKLNLPQHPIVKSVCFSKLYKAILASAFDDGSVMLCDVYGGKTLAKFEQIHKAPAMDLAVSPVCGYTFASVGLDKKIVLYRKKQTQSIDTDHILRSVTFSSDGTRLFIGTSKGFVICINLTGGLLEEDRSFPAHDNAVQQITLAAFPISFEAHMNTNGFKTDQTTTNQEQMDYSPAVGATSTSVPALFDGIISPLKNESSNKTELLMEPSPLSSSQDSPFLESSPSFDHSSLPRNRSENGRQQDRLLFPVFSESDENEVRLELPYDNEVEMRQQSRSEQIEKTVFPDVSRPVSASDENSVQQGRDNRYHESENDLRKIGIAKEPQNNSQIQLNTKQVDELKDYVKEAVSDMRHSTHQEYMHLLKKMVQFNVDLQAEIQSLRSECQLNMDLVEELFRLRDENVRLKAAY